MERLTERFDGWVLRKGCHGPCRTCPGAECADIYPLIDRLAAYEDTGTTPEEIEKAMEDCADTVAKNQFAISDINEMGGIDHIRELIQAEKDGRLVVLPCKPDASAYQWKKGDDIPSLFRFDGVNINEDGEITYQTHWGETFTPDDFGKTVFLTREETEAALKKREADDDVD